MYFVFEIQNFLLLYGIKMKYFKDLKEKNLFK